MVQYCTESFHLRRFCFDKVVFLFGAPPFFMPINQSINHHDAPSLQPSVFYFLTHRRMRAFFGSHAIVFDTYLLSHTFEHTRTSTSSIMSILKFERKKNSE